LAEIRVGKNETLDTALKRFKRSCARDGVIAEVRKREHYEKPSVKRKNFYVRFLFYTTGVFLCSNQLMFLTR